MKKQATIRCDGCGANITGAHDAWFMTVESRRVSDVVERKALTQMLDEFSRDEGPWLERRYDFCHFGCLHRWVTKESPAA